MTVRPIFAWFDLWVGVFIDRPGQRVYIFPVAPMDTIVVLACRMEARERGLIPDYGEA